MKLKAQIMTADAMDRALKRMAHQILEGNEGYQDIVFLGIRTRGVPLARALARHIREIEGVDIPVGELDITHYRDDLTEIDYSAKVHEMDLGVPVARKNVILVDDVIYTGRTTRAALDACSSLGRAQKIQLAVLIDRGHREIPIRADYVGKNVPTSHEERVNVRISSVDGTDGVQLVEN